MSELYNPNDNAEKYASNEAVLSNVLVDKLPPNPPPLVPKGWVRAVLYFFAFFVTIVITQGIAFALLIAFTDMSAAELGEHLETTADLASLTLLQSITLMGLVLQTWLFCRYIDRRTLYSLGFAYKGFARDAFMGILTGFLLISIGFVILLALGFLHIDGISFSPSTLLGSFILCIVIAFNEEIFVRGYILNNLMQSLNPYLSLLISALLFSLMHILNPNIGFISGLNIVLAGILLGLYYIFRKNLWFPIALHFAWNFFQGPVMGFEVSGLNLEGIVRQTVNGSPLLTGGDFGFEGSLLLTLLMIVAIGAIYRLYHNKPQILENQ